VLVAVAVLSILSIRSERDLATGALAAKEIAESEQERIRQEQQDKRADLVRIARERLAAQRAELARIAPDPPELTRQSEDLLPMLRRPDRSEGDRTAATGMISRLLSAATARTEFLRLALEPVAGQREQLAPQDELAREQEQLLVDWLCAARLAAANDDFFLAELILSYTQGGDARRKAAAEEIRVAKTALLEYRRDRIARILTYIRAGKEDDNVPVNAARVQDYITLVGGWREQQTADLLVEALQPRIESAKAEPAGTVWNIRQRFEIQFISDVLVQVGLAERAVPALSQLMMALSDHDLVVHLAFTLCRLQHSSAWRPLVELRYKHGAESAVWTRVKRQFRRVPEPADAGNAVGPAERLNLALLRLEQNRLEQARSDLEAILVEHPAHQDTLLELSRAQPLFRISGWVEKSNELVDRLLKENPFHGRGLAWKAELMRFGFPQRRAGSTDEEVRAAQGVQQELLARALAASPRDWWVHKICSEQRFIVEADGETRVAADLALSDVSNAIEFAPNVPDLYYLRARFTLAAGALAAENEDEGASAAAPKALVDLNRAIEMDPENSTYFSWRARIHELRKDFDASARDYSRAIELDPGHFRHYEARGYLRLRLKDFKGALEDFDVVIELRGEDYPPAFANKGHAYEDMGDFREAIRFYRKYIDMRPGFWDNARLQEKIEALEKKLEEGSGE
jgi:tetratricopeptide (TPR) repeat protein